eukprot:2697614-Pleurochrysis_carterae.AAC.3
MGQKSIQKQLARAASYFSLSLSAPAAWSRLLARRAEVVLERLGGLLVEPRALAVAPARAPVALDPHTLEREVVVGQVAV